MSVFGITERPMQIVPQRQSEPQAEPRAEREASAQVVQLEAEAALAAERLSLFKAREELAAARARHKDAENKISGLMGREESLASEVKRREESEAALRRELDAARSLFDRTRTERDAAAGKLQRLVEFARAIESRERAAQQQLLEARARADRAEERNRALSERVAELNARMRSDRESLAETLKVERKRHDEDRARLEEAQSRVQREMGEKEVSARFLRETEGRALEMARENDRLRELHSRAEGTLRRLAAENAELRRRVTMAERPPMPQRSPQSSAPRAEDSTHRQVEALAAANERLRLEARELRSETERLKTRYPLRDLLASKESELETSRTALAKMRAGERKAARRDPKRGELEQYVELLQEQCAQLRALVAGKPAPAAKPVRRARPGPPPFHHFTAYPPEADAAIVKDIESD